jgi:lipopolysaccharide/colanic/teichoic acid biosynthesis glycosyltransferase
MSQSTLSTLQSELLSTERSSGVQLADRAAIWPNLTQFPVRSPSATVETAKSPRAVQEQLLIRPAGNRSPVYRFLKRTIDIVGAILLLIVLAPMLLTTLFVLMISTKGRPFFVQERVGFCGRRFRIIKFRTMVLEAESLKKFVTNQQDGPIFKNDADPRVTHVGRFLRSTSIDETPQLINVLLGQMSLVGPRPHPISEVAEYTPSQRQRLAIKPGLTCLWQVEGRSELGFEEGVQMDIWYIQHQGLLTDLQLLFRTPLSVLSRRGAY